MKFYLYIDYGSGYVLVDPQNIQLKLGLRREINPFIYRKFINGSFALMGTEATTAYTYFITNGNYEAPIQIYENGTSGGGGVLKYEGWGKINGEYDLIANTITFNSFRTNDYYTDLIPFLQTSAKGEELGAVGYGSFVDRFAVQGLDTNSNVIQAYAWSGTAWTTSGNTLAVTDVGRVQVASFGGGIAVYDNTTKDLRKYTYTAPNFSLSTNGTTLIMGTNAGNAAITGYTATQLAFVDDFYCNLRIYTQAVGTWTLTLNADIETIKFPSLALVNTGILALVDEGTKQLRAFAGVGQYGNPLALGDVLKPKICALDSASGNIAMVDAGTQTLRTFNLNTGVWTQVGTPINIGLVIEPTITFEATNTVNIYDSFTGNLERYTYAAGVWTKSGNTTSIGGGYSAGIAYISTATVLAFIQSDTYVFSTRIANDIISTFNNLSFFLGLTDGLSDGYAVNAGNGSAIDLTKTYIGSLPNTMELNRISSTNENREDYTFEKLFNIMEMFQNYWYVEYNAAAAIGDIEIKFTQPSLFSSFGTDIDVSAYLGNLNKRTYGEKFEISKEEISFKNERSSNVIQYNRSTPITERYPYDITTNLQYLIDFFNKVDFNFQMAGLFLMYGSVTANGFVCEAGTSVGGDTNTKNNELRLAEIVENYWKDYRYANTGNMTINGNSVAVQNTVRDMIQFPDVQFSEADVGLTELPDDIGSLDWGGGIKSYITELSVDLFSYVYTASSTLLDL